jgi:hypothetical protein
MKKAGIAPRPARQVVREIRASTADAGQRGGRRLDTVDGYAASESESQKSEGEELAHREGTPRREGSAVGLAGHGGGRPFDAVERDRAPGNATSQKGENDQFAHSGTPRVVNPFYGEFPAFAVICITLSRSQRPLERLAPYSIAPIVLRAIRARAPH